MKSETKIAQCTQLIKFSEKILDMVKEGFSQRNKTNRRLNPDDQLLLHGLAWLATYVEGLRQILYWSRLLEEKGEFGELENLIFEIVVIEKFKEILFGIPLNATEYIRLVDFGLDLTNVLDKLDDRLFRYLNNQPYIDGQKKRLIQLSQSMEQEPIIENSGLSQEYDLIRDQFKKFNKSFVEQHANSWHLNNELIPKKVFEKLSELGVFGLTMPELYGGLGLNKLAMCVVAEELSRGYIGVGSLATRTEIANELILDAGTEYQKQFWLPKISRGETVPAAVFTEPGSGSDLASINTFAKLNRKAYLISGNKTWITHGSRADLMILLARTDPNVSPKHRGLSIFLAPKAKASLNDLFPDEAISGTEIKVLGYRGMKEFEMRFENFRVKKNGLLGDIENNGFGQLMKTFESARIQTAARSVGVAQKAFSLALAYANNRSQFGQKIIEFQRVYNKLALMIAEITFGRQLTYFAAKTKDNGDRCDLEAGMAKLLCAKIAWSCADNSLQIHGGNGYALEYEISRLLCDSRVLNIFEGSSEIQAEIIGKRILQSL